MVGSPFGDGVALAVSSRRREQHRADHDDQRADGPDGEH
ncbi:hypothetical protein GA0115253_104111, partial [Streptomyces sp. Termitarium-T10T-6]